jgi:tricorn protease
MWLETAAGSGSFELLRLPAHVGTVASPMWLGTRIFFVSDVSGCGNLHSVALNGSDLQQHTSHTQFYARHAHHDDQSIVYQAGGELFRYDLATQQVHLLESRHLFTFWHCFVRLALLHVTG